MLLFFPDEQAYAARLAAAAGLALGPIERHRFPDGELKLRLPTPLPRRVVLLRSLHDPNEKLVELLLAAGTARSLGTGHLTLVAPYLAYMRQDMAFAQGAHAMQVRIDRHDSIEEIRKPAADDALADRLARGEGHVLSHVREIRRDQREVTRAQ